MDNRSAYELRIAFRPATGPGAPVEVGRVPPGSFAVLAPIPAGEPIVLIATSPTDGRLVLAPRSFVPDSSWVWVIPHDAAFTEGTA